MGSGVARKAQYSPSSHTSNRPVVRGRCLGKLTSADASDGWAARLATAVLSGILFNWESLQMREEHTRSSAFKQQEHRWMLVARLTGRLPTAADA
jgi:hypothetical protein